MKYKYDISDFVDCLTVQKVRRELIERVKERRKELKFTQKELAKRSGVSYASIRRFESCGEISFSSLLHIANAMGCLNEFTLLFSKEKVTNLEDY
ncbi:MAG: helix-turn-helix domain-containing protein [Christensenellales bacterium]